MRPQIHWPAAALLTGFYAIAAPAYAAPQGALQQSIPPAVPQESHTPTLKLSDAQRDKIRQALKTVHTEVEFHLKNNKNAKDFQPSAGVKVPKGVTGHTLPPPVLAEMPNLKQYKYGKFNHEILIVNPMTNKIVDTFSED